MLTLNYHFNFLIVKEKFNINTHNDSYKIIFPSMMSQEPSTPPFVDLVQRVGAGKEEEPFNLVRIIPQH